MTMEKPKEQKRPPRVLVCIHCEAQVATRKPYGHRISCSHCHRLFCEMEYDDARARAARAAAMSI